MLRRFRNLLILSTAQGFLDEEKIEFCTGTKSGVVKSSQSDLCYETVVIVAIFLPSVVPRPRRHAAVTPDRVAPLTNPLNTHMLLERGCFVFHCRCQGSCPLEFVPPFRLGCGYLKENRYIQALRWTIWRARAHYGCTATGTALQACRTARSLPPANCFVASDSGDDRHRRGNKQEPEKIGAS